MLEFLSNPCVVRFYEICMRPSGFREQAAMKAVEADRSKSHSELEPGSEKLCLENNIYTTCDC